LAASSASCTVETSSSRRFASPLSLCLSHLLLTMAFTARQLGAPGSDGEDGLALPPLDDPQVPSSRRLFRQASHRHSRPTPTDPAWSPPGFMRCDGGICPSPTEITFGRHRVRFRSSLPSPSLPPFLPLTTAAQDCFALSASRPDRSGIADLVEGLLRLDPSARYVSRASLPPPSR
jgi:hypothetical protein